MFARGVPLMACLGDLKSDSGIALTLELLTPNIITYFSGYSNNQKQVIAIVFN